MTGLDAAGVGGATIAVERVAVVALLPRLQDAVAATGAHALLLLAIVATAMKARLHLLLDQGWRSFAPIIVATVTSFLLSLGAALSL